MKIIFITHAFKQCGVYQFGKAIFDVIASIPTHTTVFKECSSREDFLKVIEEECPEMIFYNYHEGTIGPNCGGMGVNLLPIIPEIKRALPRVVHMGFIHEIGESQVGSILDRFDFGVCSDPSFKNTGSRMFKTGRIVPKYENRYPLPKLPVIGSFGFGCAHKGYERLVKMVQDQFNEATIRINMAIHTHDPNGNIVRNRAKECRKMLTKPGIRLEITHDFMPQEGLIDFLAKNSMNAFLYDDSIRVAADGGVRGVSSTVDFALAAKRPIAVSKSSMFRHVANAVPSIIADDTSLSTIMNNGLMPLEKFYKEWTTEKVKDEYTAILNHVSQASLQRDG